MALRLHIILLFVSYWPELEAGAHLVAKLYGRISLYSGGDVPSYISTTKGRKKTVDIGGHRVMFSTIGKAGVM